MSRADNEKQTMEDMFSSMFNLQRLQSHYQSFKYQTSLPLWNELTFRPSFRRHGGIRNIGTSRVRSTRNTAAAHRNPIFVSPSSIGICVLFPSNTSSASLSILGEASMSGSNISSIIRFHFPELSCSSSRASDRHRANLIQSTKSLGVFFLSSSTVVRESVEVA